MMSKLARVVKKRFEPGIFITEYHEDVIRYIYRAFGSKSMPFSNNTLVHFDAHPDLASPPNLQAMDVFDVSKVLSCITSESWILPLIFAGHFNKVFWFKPPWSPQFIDGIYEFYVGRCPDEGTIKVSCKENYFVCDGHFCPEAKLLDKVPLRFIVLTVGISENFNFLVSLVRCIPIDDSGFPGSQDVKSKLKSADAERSKDLSNFVSLIGASDWVLDIDLDFFASQDPVKMMLQTDENFALFRKVYRNVPSSAADQKLEEHMQRKKREFAQMGSTMEKYFATKPRGKLPPETNAHVAALIRAIDDLKIDWEIVHDHGVSMGNSRLPHHQSSEEQISYLMSGAERILASIKRPPSIVTIARSGEDEYCPPSMVPKIEALVLDRLRDLFPELTKVIKDGENA